MVKKTACCVWDLVFVLSSLSSCVTEQLCIGNDMSAWYISSENLAMTWWMKDVFLTPAPMDHYPTWSAKGCLTNTLLILLVACLSLCSRSQLNLGLAYPITFHYPGCQSLSRLLTAMAVHQRVLLQPKIHLTCRKPKLANTNPLLPISTPCEVPFSKAQAALDAIYIKRSFGSHLHSPLNGEG